MVYPYINNTIEGVQTTKTTISMRNLIVKKYINTSTNNKNEVYPFLEKDNDILSKIYYKGLKDTNLYKEGEYNNIDIIEIGESQPISSLANISINSDLFGKAEQKLTVLLDKSQTSTSKYRFKITVIKDFNHGSLYTISMIGLKFEVVEVKTTILDSYINTQSEIYQKILEYLTNNNISYSANVDTFEILIDSYNVDQPMLSFTDTNNEMSVDELNELNTDVLNIVKFNPTILTFNNSITELSIEKGIDQSEFDSILQNHLTINQLDYTYSNNEYLFKSESKSSALIITPSDSFVEITITQVVKYNSIDVIFNYLTESVTCSISKTNDNDSDDVFLLQILTPNFKLKIGDGAIKTVNSIKTLEVSSVVGFSQAPLTSNNPKLTISGFSGGELSKLEFNYIPEGVYDNIIFLSDLYNNLQPNINDNLIRQSIFNQINTFIESNNDKNPPQDFIGFVSCGNYEAVEFNVTTEFTDYDFQNKSFIPVVNMLNDEKNSSITSDMIALSTALIRTIRLSDGTDISNYMQKSAGIDNYTGGSHLLNVPYHNTYLKMLDGIVDTSLWYSKISQVMNLADIKLITSIDKPTSKSLINNNDLVLLNVFSTSTNDVFNKLEVRDLQIYWIKLCNSLIKSKLAQNKISSQNNINRGTYTVSQIKSFIINLYFTLYNEGLVDDVDKFNNTLKVDFDRKLGKLYIYGYTITSISGIDFVDNKGFII